MKKYIKRFLDIFDFKNLLFESIILSFIIVFVDALNLPTLMVKNNCLFLLILVLIFFVVKIISGNNFKLTLTKNLNTVDRYIFIYSITILILLIYVLGFDFKIYKLIVLSVLSLFLIGVYGFRIIKTNQSHEDLEFNILDLQYVCKNKIELSNKKIALLEEKDVDYDLLNKKDVINQLYNTIINCYPENNFTIGLNGKWGNGKTTIINNVLRIIEQNGLLDHYVIVKFDPWKYDDEKNILQSFLNEILNKIDYDLDIEKDNFLIQNVIDVVFESKLSGLNKMFYNEIKKIKSKVQISEVVNDYLLSNNKKLLVIFDNLDRIDADKAFFLIKCVESIVKFKSTINILLYDEQILNRLLKEKFNYEERYMEKLVQLKIDVPETDIYTINKVKEQITKNMLINGDPFIEFINDEQYDFKNMRVLKRYINSIISSNIGLDSNLNQKDDSNLKYIKSVCPELYYEIWNNKNYFITYDRQYVMEIYTWDYKRLNEDAKNYFKDLFNKKDFKNYSTYLEKMFPSVKNYLQERNPFEEHANLEEYNNSIIYNKICNARYFDLYFTREENDFIRINKEVEKIIDIINNKPDFEEEFLNLIKSFNADELKVFCEVLNINTSKLNREKNLDLIIVLYNLNLFFYDRVLFFELDSWKRVNIIIADLLSKISKEEFEKLKKLTCKNYKNLKLISNIKYWVENNKKKNIVYNFEFKELYDELCANILTNKINLYLKKNYSRGNIWSLFHYDNEETIKYVGEIVNENNIYDFISDIISVSVGTRKFGYHIDLENIKAIAPNVDIDKLIQNHVKPLSKREKFIKQVYEFSKLENKGFDDAIYVDEYIEI